MPETRRMRRALDELRALRRHVEAVAEFVDGDPRVAAEMARLRLGTALVTRWTRARLLERELADIHA